MDQLKSAEDLNPSFHDTKDLQNLDALVSDPVEKKIQYISQREE